LRRWGNLQLPPSPLESCLRRPPLAGLAGVPIDAELQGRKSPETPRQRKYSSLTVVRVSVDAAERLCNPFCIGRY
jgi:hypothetical protein